MDKIKDLRRQELKASDFNLQHLDSKVKSQLLDLLFEYGDIFSKQLYTIGKTDVLSPILHVDEGELPSTRPYNIPHALRDVLKGQLDELQRADLIEPSQSYVSFPLIMVRKKNLTGDPQQQGWRLCVDFRCLNSHLKYPRYKLPIISQLLENLRGSALFTTLDLSSSFWQIPLKQEHRDITTFSSPYGNFRYKVLPQGLSCSPETFAKLSDQLLAPISDLKISNYIDDFCVPSENVPNMLQKLRALFDRFREFGLTLNPSKCSFLIPEVEFLGHKINSDGIKPVDHNIRKITDFAPPTTAKQVRRFVGLISYYRKFVKNFSELTAPLTDLIRKGKKFRWTSEAQKSFDILKEKMQTPPILIHPDYTKEFILSTDSSDTALGGMLGQKDQFNIIHPIAYFSKKLSNSQIRYTIMQKELFAVVEATKAFKYHLFGRKFRVRCDNMAVTKVSKLESPGNRIARWFAFLSDYNFQFEHIRSAENQAADLLSRDYHVNTIQIDLPSVEDIKAAQKIDGDLKDIISGLENSRIFYPKSKPYYCLQDGLLMHVILSTRTGRKRKIFQIVIPNKYKPHILAANHLSHYGFQKTYQAIKEKYYWKNLFVDTKHYVQSCKHCMSYKSPNRTPATPVQRNFIPTRPMELVSCDIIGRLSRTSRGNMYILTFIDHFTKFIKLYAIPNQTAEMTAEKFLEYIGTFGLPEKLLSDRGTNFTSELFQSLCSKVGVTKIQTCALNPECNGQSEIINKGIKKALSIFANETSQWDEYLSYYELIYNSTMHSSIGDKPAYLHLSYDPLLPTDILLEKESGPPISYDNFVAKKTSQMQYTFKKICENLITAAETQEQYQHRKAQPRNFSPGELVYLYSPESSSDSLLPKKRTYTGPMRIIEVHNDSNYTILDPENPRAKPTKVNVRRLLKYTERRRELDYIRQLVDNERKEDIPSSTISKSLPHAKFDDLNENDLAIQWAQTQSIIQPVVPSEPPISSQTDHRIQQIDNGHTSLEGIEEDSVNIVKDNTQMLTAQKTGDNKAGRGKKVFPVVRSPYELRGQHDKGKPHNELSTARPRTIASDLGISETVQNTATKIMDLAFKFTAPDKSD